MEKTVRMKIKYDQQARDGVEVKKRQEDIFEVRISDGADLKGDKDLVETFVGKFNVAHAGMDSGKEPVLDIDNRMHRVEIARLGEAMQRGSEKYSFRLHSH